jgi:hypothetical protein
MKHYRLITGICIAFVAVGLLMWFSGLLTPMTINDISLSAELKVNDISGTNGEKYVLNIEISKERSGKNIIYMYLPGYGPISIYDGQGNFILDGRDKLDHVSELLALNELAKQTGKPLSEIGLVGEGIPFGKGNYRCKIFYGDHSEIEETEDMYVVCVHKGSNFLGDKSWVKVFRVLNAL